MKKQIPSQTYKEVIVCDACEEPQHQDDGLVHVELGVMQDIGPTGVAPLLELDLHHGCLDGVRRRMLGKE